MNTRRLARFVSAALILSVAALPACGQKAENIALGKKYTVNIPPTYSLTKDAGDMTQLTDGKYVKLLLPTDIFWTKKTAVGWNVNRNKPLEITVDLQKVEPIDAVVFSSAANLYSGVVWPMAIFVQVSEDGNNFYDAGNLVRLSQEPIPSVHEQNVMKFTATGLKTKGRYVKFLVLNGNFIFCDEIEIHRGDDAQLQQPYPDKPVTLAQLTHADRLTQEGCARRFQMDLSEVSRRLNKATLDEAARTQLDKEIASLRAEIASTRFPQSANGFKAVVPFNDLHRRIVALNANVLRANRLQGLTVWKNDRYAPLQAFDVPSGSKKVKLTVDTMQNEHRAEVFNLTNATDKEMAVSFRIDGFISSFVTPFQVEYVDTREGVVHAAALVKMTPKDGQYTTIVPAGMTRQIWLETHTKDIKAGQYKGSVVLTGQAVKESIPFEVSVYPVVMPDRLDLETGVWDYAIGKQYLITEKNIKPAIQSLKSHHVSLPWASTWQIMFPKAEQFDDAGNMIKDMDYTAFDNWVKRWPEAKRYMVFMAVSPNSKFAQKFARGTKEFNNAVGQWAAAWQKHNRSIGLKAGQVGLNLKDEPGPTVTFETIIDWTKAIKATSPDFAVFIDPVYDWMKDKDWPAFEEAIKHVDIVCPAPSQYIKSGEARQEMIQKNVLGQGKALWFYMCGGPVRWFDPAYYRLQPWYGYSVGATGSKFWGFADARAESSWNEYPAIGRTGFTPLYWTKDDMTTGKHWEAYREGVQDYQYLKMLRADKDYSHRAKIFGEVIGKEYELVARRGYQWLNGNACAKADEYRIKILKSLSKAETED